MAHDVGALTVGIGGTSAVAQGTRKGRAQTRVNVWKLRNSDSPAFEGEEERTATGEAGGGVWRKLSTRAFGEAI